MEDRIKEFMLLQDPLCACLTSILTLRNGKMAIYLYGGYRAYMSISGVGVCEGVVWYESANASHKR